MDEKASIPSDVESEGRWFKSIWAHIRKSSIQNELGIFNFKCWFKACPPTYPP